MTRPTDTPYTPDLKDMIALETEGERVTPPLVQPEEVERLMAAELILRMRRCRELALSWPEITREQYAKSFERLSLEFAAASAWLRRHRADNEFIPSYLREMA